MVSQKSEWLSGRVFNTFFYIIHLQRDTSQSAEWFIPPANDWEQYVAVILRYTARLWAVSMGVLQMELLFCWEYILVLFSNIRYFYFPGAHSKDILLPSITQCRFHFDRDSRFCINLLLSYANLPFLTVPLCLDFYARCFNTSSPFDVSWCLLPFRSEYQVSLEI